jgi:hypothetical protein
MPLLNLHFEHHLAPRTFERKNRWQELRRRLLLGFTGPDLVILFAIRTVKRNWQL